MTELEPQPSTLPVPLASRFESTKLQLERYQAGQATMRELAAECGITVQGLIKRFKVFALTVPTMGYSDVVAEHFATYIVEADENLDKAPDMVEIARAQHRCRYTRMDFERKCPDRYGPKQEIKTDNNIRVFIQPLPTVINARPEEVLRVSTNDNESSTT